MEDLEALQDQGLHVQVERTDIPAEDDRVRFELESNTMKRRQAEGHVLLK